MHSCGHTRHTYTYVYIYICIYVHVCVERNALLEKLNSNKVMQGDKANNPPRLLAYLHVQTPHPPMTM